MCEDGFDTTFIIYKGGVSYEKESSSTCAFACYGF